MRNFFYFFSGFFTPLIFIFVPRTTVLIIKDPKLVTEGLAIIYLACLTAIYYIVIAKKGAPYFSKEKNSLENRIWIIAGTLVCAVFYFIFSTDKHSSAVLVF